MKMVCSLENLAKRCVNCFYGRTSCEVLFIEQKNRKLRRLVSDFSHRYNFYNFWKLNEEFAK